MRSPADGVAFVAGALSFYVLFAIANSPTAAFVLLPLLSAQLVAFPSYRNTYRC